MKRIATILAAVAAWCGVWAQEVAPPRFQGADVQRFMARLVGETEKVIAEKEIPAGELSPQVAVGFTVDTAGYVTKWRFLDNTCEGRDFRDVEPATERTREAMTEALGRLERWTPAQQQRRATTYAWRLTMRLPVEKIARRQEADPLLFLGGDPEKTFYDWAHERLRYDERFTAKGLAGVVHVRFWVEPDGKITIGEVVSSPDERMTREVVRVIRNSRGKWTPRKVRGVAQRTAFECRINFT